MPKVFRRDRLNDAQKLELLQSLEALFWSKVARGSRDDCWLWLPKSRTLFGYGIFAPPRPGPIMNSHRAAYMLAFGALPEGHYVTHLCDNPACCNPAHLTAGTPADNQRDMRERGRQGDTRLFGPANGRSKLTPEQVLEIRQSPLGPVALARQYGVTRDTIRKARNGKNWSRV